MNGLDESLREILSFETEELDRLMAEDSARGGAENLKGFNKSVEEYHAQQVKTLVMFFGIDTHAKICEHLDAVMQENELDSHAEALEMMCFGRVESNEED